MRQKSENNEATGYTKDNAMMSRRLADPVCSVWTRGPGDGTNGEPGTP
jgi:hypothetical protein